MNSLPDDLQHKVWRMYFSEYVIKNMNHAWSAFLEAFDDSEHGFYGPWTYYPPTGKFVWRQPRHILVGNEYFVNMQRYNQQVEAWSDYDPDYRGPIYGEP